MKERGIIFGAPMVRALLAGTKVQTRRLMKLPPRGHRPNFLGKHGAVFEFCSNEHDKALGCRTDEGFTCPYGVPDDLLWVRETWRADKAWDDVGPMIIPRGSSVWFAAGGEKNVVSSADHSGKTRVSIFMPRWASRITLEVTEVRLQRLQDITEEDARAEGLTCLSKDGGRIFKWGIPDRDGLPGEDDDGEHWQNWSLTARDAYARLWDAINGAGSWASNPWVWAISFRRIAQ